MADVGVLVKSASKFAITHFESILPIFGVSIPYFIIPLIFAFSSFLLTLILFKYYKKYLPDTITENTNKPIYDTIFVLYEVIVFIFLFLIFGDIVDGIFIPILISILFIMLITHYFNHVDFDNVSLVNIKYSIGIIFNSLNINHTNKYKILIKYVLKLSACSILFVMSILLLYIFTNIEEISLTQAIIYICIQLVCSYIICLNSEKFKILKVTITFIMLDFLIFIYGYLAIFFISIMYS